jgi:4-hydroxy 2-oxovalerate aldolase
MKINIIDCTFRDGGYYNQWNFSKNLANKYLQSISDSGIRFVEIGYRRINYTGFLGPFAFCKESFLKTIEIPNKINLGLMLNLEDFKNTRDLESLVLQNFVSIKYSKINFLRIATKIEDIDLALDLSRILKKLGYFIFVNLMQSNSISSKQFILASQKINPKNKPNVFYFADTFGNLNEQKIINVIELMNKHLKTEIGFHAHNNMSNALNNSLAAIKNKVKWIDSTVMGMGRGAGNLQTEYLLLNLKKYSPKIYHPESLYPIILDDFELLKIKYRWGENLLYYLSAELNIHPSYMQELLSQDYYKTHQILDALKFLKNANHYNKIDFEHAIFSYDASVKGSCDPKKIVKQKTVLILANGQNLGFYIDEIISLIKLESPIVLSLNINKYIDEQYIDAYVVCHPSKILLDIRDLKKVKKPIIIPKKAIPKDVSGQLNNNKIIDYGITVKKNTFKAEKSSCTIPNSLAISYALSFCQSGMARNVYLAGFDGYESNDPRLLQVNSTLKYFLNSTPKIKIELITPSGYEAPVNSIYSILK